MIDSHCHVYPSQYGDDTDAALDRARAAGVDQLVLIGAGGDLATCDEAIAIAERRPDVWATAGFHPHYAEGVQDDMLEALRERVTHPRVVAVGEMGLDYHYDYSPREKQQAVFRAQVEVAREVSKPIVIHNRTSDEDCARIFDEAGLSDVGGVVHCFTSGWDLAKKALDHGFCLGFTGIVSFKNAREIREVLERVPHDRVMIETDSPYLAPVPHRGRRNEPAYLPAVARAVAETLGLSVDEVERLTDANTRRLFGIPSPGDSTP